MAYQLLAPVAVTATLDNTGKNPGNYTNAFTSSLLPNVNTYEVWHMAVTGAPILAAAQITMRSKVFSTVTVDTNGLNEWDPAQAAILNVGDEIYFFWNVAASTGTPPAVTCWLRYDPELPQNKYLPGSLWAGGALR